MRRESRVWGGLLIAGLASLSGACEQASADSTPPPGGPAVAVVASISAATLADDCAPPTPAPATTAPSGATGDVARGYSGQRMGRRGCRQTSVQLALATAADGQPSTFTVVKAQLFDGTTGALLQDMTTRNPQVWSDTGRYLPWDRAVRPGQKLQVTYDMNAPNWSKMGGSQLAAQGKIFRLEMTVRVGNKETKIGSTVRSAELMIEPHVVT